MNNTEKVYLNVLADFVNSRPTELPKHIDLKWLLYTAHKHSTGGIIYHQCKEQLNGVVLQKANQIYSDEINIYTNRCRYMSEIIECFNKEQIDFITVSGMNFVELYPAPELRTMGDCDIVVHKECIHQVDKIMQSSGFEFDREHITERRYCKDQLEIKLHDNLYYDIDLPKDADTTDIRDCWQLASPEVNTHHRRLNWNCELVYLVVHLRKNFLYTGAGFRQFMDLAMIAKTQQLDWDLITSTLTKLQIDEFADLCFALCERWFDVTIPHLTQPDEALYETATVTIMDCGVFGDQTRTAAEVARLRSAQTHGRTGLVMSTAFPSYEKMRQAESYNYVNGRPYLMPFAWVHRMFKGIGKKGKDNPFNNIPEKYEVAQRNKLMNDWKIKE